MYISPFLPPPPSLHPPRTSSSFLFFFTAISFFLFFSRSQLNTHHMHLSSFPLFFFLVDTSCHNTTSSHLKYITPHHTTPLPPSLPLPPQPHHTPPIFTPHNLPLSSHLISSMPFPSPAPPLSSLPSPINPIKSLATLYPLPPTVCTRNRTVGYSCGLGCEAGRGVCVLFSQILHAAKKRHVKNHS